MERPHIHIIIGSDGTVLGSSECFYTALTHAHVSDCVDLPEAVREAAAAALQELHDQSRRCSSRTATIGVDAVDVIAVEAIAIRRTPVDLHALLSAKLNVLQSQAQDAGVALSIDATSEVPGHILLDGEKVAWMITTLVGNALRYVQQGVRQPGATIAVRAGYDAASHEVLLTVRDTGPGVPGDTVARLFKRDGLNVRGPGLALLLMQDICAAHEGTIAVESSVDVRHHGTTVRLRLKS